MGLHKALSLLLPEDIFKKLEEVARARMEPRATVIRQLIEEAYAKLHRGQ